MKTILVPTDYSETANNARDYAVQLAARSNAKIILLHIYQEPVAFVGDIPVPILTSQEAVKLEEERISKERRAVEDTYPGKLKVETILRTGIIRNEIENVAGENNADLIVMGMKASSGVLQRMLGNVSINTMKKSKTPVLIVPGDVRFDGIKRIALAHDRKTEMNAEAVQLIKHFTDLFSAELVVVNVTDPTEPGSAKQLQSVGEIEQSLGGIPRSIVTEVGEDIAHELETFVEDEECDLLIMIPHRHFYNGELFHRSQTKRTAFQSSVPVLTIHD